METNGIVQRTLTVCCPHLADEGTPNTLVVEGGPLVLFPPINLMRGPLEIMAWVQDIALAKLRAWNSQPGRGRLSLLAHPDCACEFLARLDHRDTRHELRLLARELHEDLFGQPRVSVEIVDLSELIEPAPSGRKRRQSGERFISSTDLKALCAAAERRSA